MQARAERERDSAKPQAKRAAIKQMTKQDRQKLSIFVVLLAVLGLTIVLGYRMNRPQTTAAVQTPPPKTSTNPPAAHDTRIRLDLVENSGSSEENIGKKNVFQYQQAPP